MGRSSPLPEQIRYLEPFRKQLLKLGPEIHEDVDLTVLKTVVRERVAGLSPEETKRTLDQDGIILDEWLSLPKQQNEPLHFVMPFLAMGAADVLLEDKPEPPPDKFVQMELPHKAKIIDEAYGALLFSLPRKVHVNFYPSSKEMMEMDRSQFQIDAKHADEGFVAEVEFGKVKGLKCVRIGQSPPYKRVDYTLEVPGGWVIGGLQTENNKFDELLLEQNLHTLRIVKSEEQKR